MFQGLVSILLTCFTIHPNQGSLTLCPINCSCAHTHGRFTTDCSNRGLTQIPEDISPRTMSLILDGNELNLRHVGRKSKNKLNEQEEPQPYFVNRNLHHLTELSLSNCGLTELKRHSLRGLQNLRRLVLSHNRLTKISKSLFRDMAQLIRVDVSYNRLKDIPSNAFLGASDLEEIDLSNNNIEWLFDDSFSNLPKLRALYLNNNYFFGLRPVPFEKLSNLHLLNLVDNPWVCDCSLRALVKWERPRYLSSPPSCETPVVYWHKRWDQLSFDEFACPVKLEPVFSDFSGAAKSRELSAEIGQTVLMTCRSEADPPAPMRWEFYPFLVNDTTATSERKRKEEDNYYNNSTQKATIVSSLRRSISNRSDPTKSTGRFSTLTILTALPGDSGEYYCIADNNVYSQNISFSLYISKPTNISSIEDNSGFRVNLLFLVFLISIGCSGSVCLLVIAVCYCKRGRISHRRKSVHFSSAIDVRGDFDQNIDHSIDQSIVYHRPAVNATTSSVETLPSLTENPYSATPMCHNRTPISAKRVHIRETTELIFSPTHSRSLPEVPVLKYVNGQVTNQYHTIDRYERTRANRIIPFEGHKTLDRSTGNESPLRETVL